MIEDPRIRTMADLFEAWLGHLAVLGRSPSTLASYRYKIDAVLDPAIGGLDPRSLTVLGIDRLYAELIAGGMSPATVHHHHRILRAALSQGARWGVVEANPARLASPPSQRSAVGRPPSPAQVRQLVAFAAEGPCPRLASVILLAATTGMRRGELAGLRWSRVDLEGCSVEVASSIWQVASRWGEKLPKSQQHRRVPLGERTMALLTDLRVETGSSHDAFVLSRGHGEQPFLPDAITSAFRRTLVSLRSATGEHWPFRFHDLRHFTATELFRAGHSATTVAARLGHADVAVTLRTYAHDTEDQARRAGADIEREL